MGHNEKPHNKRGLKATVPLPHWRCPQPAAPGPLRCSSVSFFGCGRFFSNHPSSEERNSKHEPRRIRPRTGHRGHHPASHSGQPGTLLEATAAGHEGRCTPPLVVQTSINHNPTFLFVLSPPTPLARDVT